MFPRFRVVYCEDDEPLWRLIVHYTSHHFCLPAICLNYCVRYFHMFNLTMACRRACNWQLADGTPAQLQPSRVVRLLLVAVFSFFESVRLGLGRDRNLRRRAKRRRSATLLHERPERPRRARSIRPIEPDEGGCPICVALLSRVLFLAARTVCGCQFLSPRSTAIVCMPPLKY